MNIGALEHVNLRTSRLGEMIAWYGRVLGLRPGFRPDFPFPGAWLYTGDNKPTVHLVGVGEEPVSGLKLEHFAFSATGLPECIARLKSERVPYELIRVGDAALVQVNVYDPDGNHIHVDFAEREAAGLESEKISEFMGLPGR